MTAMMAMIWLILGLSILVQCAAAVLALRLNWVYGNRWAWTLISVAIVLTAINRCISLYALRSVELEAGNAMWLDAVTPIVSSLASLGISIFTLIGVALIDPLFRDIARAKEVLEGEKLQLQSVVQSTEEELRLAREVQQQFFPSSPPALEGYEIAGASIPAEATGGDYYDFFPMRNGCVGIAVGDVSGHGMGPALLMAVTRAYLRPLALTQDDLGKILTSANRFIADDVKGKRFVTLFLGQLEAARQSFAYAGAGHRGYVIEKSGRVKTLDSTGLPLGMDRDARIARGPEVTLKPGDIVLLLTDGILEQRSQTGELFGIERALEIVRTGRDKPAKAILDNLFRAVREFADATPQGDDLTAVVIKVKRTALAGPTIAG